MIPPTLRKSAAFTLVEMLMAMMVMSMIAVSLAFLATAVEESSEHTLGHGNAAQHARVALERIERMCRESHATEDFPGFYAFSEQVGSYSFPDALAVWYPPGTPVDPEGLPRFNELVFYFPNPSAPNELLEVTVPGDSRTVPELSETSTWLAELSLIRSSDSASRVVLTELLYTALAGDSSQRGAIRFQTLHWPHPLYMSYLRLGAMSWNLLPCVQSIKNEECGLAQNTCKIEIFMVADDQIGEMNLALPPLPFFGSEAVHYLVYR